MTIPSLKFLKQTSLSVDRFCDNGIEKQLHYVIKNNEFLVLIELPDELESETFNDLSLETHLLYDCSPDPKDVLQVRQKPFRYKGSVDAKDTRKCCLQASISILSSQHEDMNFLLFIQAKHAKTGEVLAKGYSDPVQVISKPDVLRKKREPKKKKRTWNERVTEMLETIAAKQDKQEEILKQMRDTPHVDPFTSLFGTPGKETPSQKFERAYYDMLSAYREIQPSDRPTKIRKLVDSNPGDEDDAADLFDCFQSALPRPGSSPQYPKKNFVPPVVDCDLDIHNLVEELFSADNGVFQ